MEPPFITSFLESPFISYISCKLLDTSQTMQSASKMLMPLQKAALSSKNQCTKDIIVLPSVPPMICFM